MPETQSYLLTTAGSALTTFDAYAQQGGFTGLRQALTNMTPAQVLGELRTAGLRGRGGAGVLTAEKLKLVAQAATNEKYLVCNAYDADLALCGRGQPVGAQPLPRHRRHRAGGLCH